MRRKINAKRIAITLGILLIVLMMGFGGFMIYGSYKLNQLANMSAHEMIAYTTKNKEDALITVGILQNGEMTYTVYGENGVIQPQKEIEYEIGSITKTFTAALLSKAIHEGKVRLDDPIDRYLDLPEENVYPTLKSLVTHTSGYKNYYFETPMISNFLNGRNDFYGINEDLLMNRIQKVNIQEKDHSFEYSNFGMATIGLVLEKVYDEDYTLLMNRYLKEELGLSHTKLPDESDDLKNAWQWKDSDAYLPAGALRSTILDLLEYAQMNLTGNPDYLTLTHKSLLTINASSQTREKMGIHMDEIGISWIIDTGNSIVWHNGGTGNYNSYIGFDKEKQIAVVVLSNLPPNVRIPATVIGIEVLTTLQKKYPFSVYIY